MTSCLIVAGEKSGEEHCMSFLPALKEMMPEASFFGVGGDELKEQGVELLYEIKDFQAIGFGPDVLKKIPFFFKAMDHLVDECKKCNAKVAILVDFQGFNLKIGEKLKNEGIKVLHFAAPQAWGWRPKRVEKIKRNVHTLFTLLPFEKEWFGSRGVKNIVPVKHPVLETYKDDLRDFQPKMSFNQKKIKLLLLPGSRDSEVSKLLPIFLEATYLLRQEFNIEISIVKSPTVKQKAYDIYKEDFHTVYENDELTTALKESDFCFASSGTVTLTCALFGLPTIVCYQISLLNEFLARQIIKYNWFISLANIVHEDNVFPEYIQAEVKAEVLFAKLKSWLKNKDEYNQIKEKLLNTKELLSGDENPPEYYMKKALEDKG